MRQKKLYKQYEVIQVNGKWQYKKAVNPETGKKEKEEYVGRFKESSLNAMKSTMVEQLVQDKDVNIRINALIREELVKSAKNYKLYQDEDFRRAILDIYHKLPEDKRICNYGNNVMQPLRSEIDALSIGRGTTETVKKQRGGLQKQRRMENKILQKRCIS